MSICNICPRNCNVDRSVVKGFCGVFDTVKISRAALHMWEEPCISGEKGSGTVFFSGCNMRCIFCQNKEISLEGFGKEITIQRLCDIFLELQAKGALNINLVTPTHYTTQIIQAVKLAKAKGLTLPILYNTGSYEKVETIKMLEGIVDIWLPDFKYIDEEAAVKYAQSPHYPEYAKAVIDEMVRQQPECVFDEDGIIQKGVIIRHLVLPGQVKAAKKIMKYLHNRYGEKVFISIMSQYVPCNDLSSCPEIDRKLTWDEYYEVVDYAVDQGIENGFIQEEEAADESFIPPFDLEGVEEIPELPKKE